MRNNGVRYTSPDITRYYPDITNNGVTYGTSGGIGFGAGVGGAVTQKNTIPIYRFNQN